MTRERQQVGRFSRRTLLRSGALAAAAVSLAPLLAACGSQPEPTAAPKPAATTAPAAPAATAAPAAQPTVAAAAKSAAGGKKLLAMYWSDSPNDHNVWVDVFKAYESKNPGTTIEFDDTPSGDFPQKLTTMMAGGTPPDFHALHINWVMQFVTANTLTDLTDRMKADKASFEDYFPQQLAYWTDKGRIWGVPYYSGLSTIFYNKDIFQKKGVKTPEEYEKAGNWNWDTFREAARLTSGGTGADKTIGFDGANGNPWNMPYYLCVPVWSDGGEFINKEETAWLVDSDVVVQKVQDLADMYLKDKSLAGASDVQGTTQVFWTGRVAMAWGIKAHVVSAPADKINIGQAPVPKGKVGRINRDGPNATGVPVAGKNIDDAYKVAAFSPSGDSPYLSSGRSFPVRRSLEGSDMYKKGLRPYENPAIWAEAAATLRPWRIPGKGTEIARVFKEAGDKVLAGQVSAKDAMKAVKPEMDSLLK